MDVNHVSLMSEPANRIELSGPAGKAEIAAGDAVSVRVHFASPCEEVAAEFLQSRYFNYLQPFKYDGKTNAIALKPLDGTRRVWGADLKIEKSCACKARSVYVRATALGGGLDRPLYGNFAVPFKGE